MAKVPPLALPSGAEQAKALREEARQGGLRFEVYLPPRLADWLLDLIERGEFIDPSAAAFVILDEHSELALHPDLREELLRRRMQAALDDPGLLLKGEEVRARLEQRAAQQRNPAVWKGGSHTAEPPNLLPLVEAWRQDEAAANIFEAIASGDMARIIAVVDPAFKRAAREASDRAHAKGIPVVDGRANTDRKSMPDSPNILNLLEAGRELEAILLLEAGLHQVGAIGPRSAQVALEASARLFAGDFAATITFMNYRHPWLSGLTVMERAEQSDKDLAFVIDMIGAIEAGVHI